MARPDPLAKAFVEAAFELHRARLWLECEPDLPFLVAVPGEEHPLVAVIIGHFGQDYGVMLERGERAFARMLERIARGPQHADEVNDPSDFLSVTLDLLGSIPVALRAPLQAGGFASRRESLAPYAFAKPPYRNARPPNKGELRTLVLALRGILAAHAAGELRLESSDLRRRRVLQLEVTGSPRQVAARARRVPWPAGASTPAPQALLALPDHLADLPRLDEPLLLDLIWVPGEVQGDDRTLHMLAAAEEGSGRLLGFEVFFSDDFPAMGAWLAGFFQGDLPEVPPGLPCAILFASSRLHDVLAPALAGFGVRTEVVTDHPVSKLLAESAREVFERGPRAPRSEREPSDLEEWKEADRAVTAGLTVRMKRGKLSMNRALARYFGDPDLGLEVLEELGALAPEAAFSEWLCAEYRPTSRSKTLMEEWLAQRRLAPGTRALLEARASAELSIYRVDSTEPGSTLEVECIFTGRRRTVHDRAMSGCGLEGFFVPLRLARVADTWYFPSTAGPPFNAFTIGPALELLEELCPELSPSGLRRAPHALGRLWELVLEEEEPPALQNTDGDPLELQTALFRVADAAALARALDAREDLERDEETGRWTWSRPGGPAPGVGETTILAWLELIDDRLVVELNSARRLERARAWLERIPGVAFERTTPQAVPTLDDRLPGPPPAPFPPELVAELRRQQEAHSRAWLDLPVPALSGQTPRAACRTEAGRRLVATMIRTMPPMHFPGGSLPAPVDFLLRELGIDPGA